MMRTVTYKLDDLKDVVIHIGRAEENLATRVRIDAGKVFAEYPAAVPTMKVINPAGTVYGREVSRDGDLVIWDVTESDLAAEGQGEMQLTFTENSVIVKSADARTEVCRSIVGGTTPPDPVQDWIDRAEEVLEEVEDAFPEGGTTGQVLAKKSNADFDTEWVDQGSGGTTDYTDLENKPQIGGVTLTGDKSLHDLGAAAESDIPDVSGFYTKPAGGIPASDIAAGVIPDPEDLIDDTAGAGDTDKTWSADKLTSDVLSAIDKLTPDATASDVGKAIIVKTVADGKPSSYEYGEAGGGVDPQDIAEAVDAWCDENITNPDSPPLDRSLTASSAAAPADIVGGIVNKLQKVSVAGSANKWNKDTAKVGLVHTNGNVYTGGSYDNYKYNDPLPVQPGDEIRYYYINNGAITAGSMVRVVAYDSNDSVVSASSVSESSLYTVPNGISSVIITIGGTRNDSAMVIINDATSPSEYIPYDEGYSYYLATSDFIGDKQVKIKNCDFVEYSENLFDKTAVETGLLNKSTGALLTNYTNYATSDWIEVEGSTDYTFSSSYNTYLYWCWYNSDKEWISGGEKNIETEPTKQSPSTAKYIRFSLLKERINESIQFEKGSTASGYETFGHAYIKPEYIPPESMGFVCNLPKKIYALVGYETNIYFENIVEDWTKYKWDVSCSKGKQLERGYRITPAAADVGSYTLRFFLSIGDYTESFSTTLVVVSASAGNNVSEKLIILGDSTTANGTAVTKLNANLASDVYSLSTIGTKGTAPNNHEGRSGWRLSNYFTTSSDNAFYNPNTQTFDASYYFTNSGVAKPDWFFINLGINDVFSYSSDEDLNEAIEQCKEYLDAMIDSILDASPNTKIGVCLTIPPNHSQDAFGKEYNCDQNRNRYKRNNLLWVHSLIEEYDNREDEGIYLIPIHMVLDTVYNMGFETIPVNARNTAITYESPIGNGGVHPVESGYWQIADQYTAFLKGNAT